MKFLHTSDWHVGEPSMAGLCWRSRRAFQQIVDLAISEKVDGVIIAGDLYDRAVPPVDAIKLFNKTLARLVLEEQIPSMPLVVITMGLNVCILGETFFNLRVFI